MKVAELRSKNPAELEQLAATKRHELAELRLQLRTGEVKNIRQERQLKKDIARILTCLSEQSLQKQEAA